MITKSSAESASSTPPELDELLSPERHRPKPSAEVEHRVEARLARTLGWDGAGGGPGAGGGLFASPAVVYALVALLSLGCIVGVIGFRHHGADARAVGRAATSRQERDAVVSRPSSLATRLGPLRLLSGTSEADPRKENGTFEGSVRSSPTGRPLGHAQLVFSRGSQTFSTLSRDDGTFVFDAPEPGRYALAHASAEGHIDFAPAWGESSVELFTRPGKRIKDATIYLMPAIEYVGVVLSPSHEPVTEATVRFVSPATGRVDHAVTDAKGEFRLVLDAEDVLLVTHPNFAPKEARIHLAEQTARRLVVQLAAKGAGVVVSPPQIAGDVHPGGGGRLHGTVQDARKNAPLAAFSVVVRSLRGSLQRQTVVIRSFFDASGVYELQDLDPGDYVVTAVAEGFAPSVDTNVTIGGQEDDDVVRLFRLERGPRVLGTVVDEATKRAIAGAQVSLEGALASEQAPVRLLAATVTDDDGNFELAGLSAGLRSIMVSEPHHHGRISSSFDAGAKGDIGPIQIELARAEHGEEPRLELTGIGAVLTAREDVLLITQILDEGGASEVGLVPGDVIVAIDGAAANDLGFDQAIQRVRGPEGSAVVLTLRRAAGGPIVDVRVPRRRVHVH